MGVRSICLGSRGVSGPRVLRPTPVGGLPSEATASQRVAEAEFEKSESVLSGWSRGADVLGGFELLWPIRGVLAK